MCPKDYTINLVLRKHVIEETLQAFFHTILLHRTFPTLSFKDGAVSYTSYIGVEDVDCKNFDLTYVRVASERLHERIAIHIASFSKALCDESDDGLNKTVKGTITLAFVTNRKGSWVLGSESASWERWIFNIEASPDISDDSYRSKIASQAKGEILYILDCINTSESFLPELGSSQSECDIVIDFSLPEVSPYRFNINYFLGSTQNNPSNVRRY
ncbi:unnamed protein product [Rodentolepis nana]|uniref:Autophagy-related protein 101 n=1 Tax=Rodentolepis nana TaxID=102285 RepID=A0A0R3T6V2_RODNA|nr:unnamed protein product [Rodentolepis nana]